MIYTQFNEERQDSVLWEMRVIVHTVMRQQNIV
jgi:hypothetical protein